MNSDRLSVIFFNLFIISFPLSVTASQSFAILSTILFLYSSYFKKSLVVTLGNRTFIAGIVMYLVLFLAFLFHLFQYEISVFKILTRSEISDFWMCFLILPAFYHIRNLEYKHSIYCSFYFSSFLVVCTGFISIFTPFRLAPFITAGFQVTEGARLQHFAGDFWGRYTFLPIGLMNTHLTFGGLCGLLFPGILVHLSLTFKERNFWKNSILVSIMLIFPLVLFYNQSRSIWLGLAFTFVLIFIKLIQNLAERGIQLRWKYLLIVFTLLSILLGVSLNIYKKNWLIQRAFQEGLADNTTENQRYFIYKNTLSIIKNHWILGVGPGRFDVMHQAESDRMIQDNEQLWYELFITPRQHGHNDLLHFYSIGGLFGLIAFLYFWFHLLRLFIKYPLTSQSVLFSGILVLFVAGFFQCYLLDDEVALPFFAMIGLYAGSLQKEDARSKAISGLRARKTFHPIDSFQVESISIGSSFVFLKRQIALGGKNFSIDKKTFYAFFTLVIPIAFSLSYIFYKARLEPMEVYRRKVTVSKLENRKYVFKALSGKSTHYPVADMKEKDTIRIEGCLSHRFSNPISIRTESYKIAFVYSEKLENPPKFVTVRIKERDAFDQDRLYKVHQVKPIGGEYNFSLANNGKTIIVLDDSELYRNLFESKRIPDNIYFRDFEFQFHGFDITQDYFDLPAIDFGKLCNAK